MSSDEADKKSVDEDTKDVSLEEENVKEEKKGKPASKKKAADPPKIKQPAKKRVKTEESENEAKKEDKKEDKKKEEDEDDDDDDSAEENDVENHTVPLLDQPLEISGSRRRKEVQRFTFKETEGEQKEVKIPEGKGKPLGEIEWIEHSITRARPEDLKLLHRICFGKSTKAALVKKNLKKFNGFDFEEASDDYEKKKVQFGASNKKVKVMNLKNICHMLDLEQKGSKDEIVDRILSFLTCPVDSGRKIGTGRSKRKGASEKNYDEGADEAYKSKKKNKSKKICEESEESEKEKSGDEEDNEEEADVKTNNKEKNNEESEEDEKEEEEEKPKKVAKNKKTKKAAEVSEKKAPPKKRAAAKKAAEKKVESEEDGDGEEEEDEEEPAAKKTKTPPTDEEIKAYVKSLLEGANLELVTMKKVCEDVYAHYPDHDLVHKKAFIKTTVKSLISS